MCIDENGRIGHDTRQESGNRKKGREMDDFVEDWNGKEVSCVLFVFVLLGWVALVLTIAMVNPFAFLCLSPHPFPRRYSMFWCCWQWIKQEGLERGCASPTSPTHNERGNFEGESIPAPAAK